MSISTPVIVTYSTKTIVTNSIFPYKGLVKKARKFRESAPNQIPIFLKPPPRVGVSENVWFFKFERVDRANMRRN